MSDIFIRVYLDEDVDVLIASLLWSRIEAFTAQQSSQLGKLHPEQLEYAISQKTAMLTHNRKDFEALAQQYFEQRPHYGVIVAVRNPYPEIVRRLLIILNSTTIDEMQNQILYIWMLPNWQIDRYNRQFR